MLSGLISIVPLICLIALLAFTVIYVMKAKRIRNTSVGTLLWAGFYVFSLVVLGLLCLAGLVENDAASLFLASIVALVCGILVLARETVREALSGLELRDSRGRVIARCILVLRDCLALLICTAASFCALELPYNIYLLPTDDVGALYQVVLIGVVLLVLYLLAQRHGVGLVLGIIAFLALGIAEYFVIKFKGTSIAASDIFAINTAAAVSDAYIYSIDEGVLQGTACAFVGICAASFVFPVSHRTRRTRIVDVVGNLSVSVCCIAALLGFVTHVNVKEAYDIWPDYWNSIPQHSANGFLSTFVTEAQNLDIEAPEGYTDEKAEELISYYADQYDTSTGQTAARAESVEQFNEIQPNVIVVMDEAFADLSIINELGCGYSGPEFWNTGMSDSLLSGAMYTSVLGTGTCNTEFEFLTNAAMLFVGDGKLVYPMYDLSNIDTLPRQFKKLGYACTAMHPNLASNWSRDRVYPEMGFDQFLSIDDFEGAPSFHSGVTDAATFDKCLEVLESGNTPQFIFAVTMQNHSAYTQGNIPAPQLTSYEPEGAGTAEDAAQLNEYLSCIDATDADLRAFVEELRGIDKPTVLVFFGDHQPFVSQVYNDAYFTGETDVAHAARIYQTSYRIWANYDVAGSDQVDLKSDLSAPVLGAEMMNIIGVPLTDYQKAMLAYRSNVPLTYAYGYMAPDGVWYANYWEEAPHRNLYRELGYMQYWHFGARVH